jgi:hypothetical protein
MTDVSINGAQRVIEHDQASMALNRYTHTPDDHAARVLASFDSSAASDEKMHHHV